MALRLIIALMALLLVLLQVQLWGAEDGFGGVARLEDLITRQAGENARLAQRNRRLEAEVDELRQGGAAIEERARADLGLIRPDESFYLFSGAPAPE